MRQIFFLLFLVTSSLTLQAQIQPTTDEYGNVQNLDSLANDEIKVKLSGKTVYTDYKIISHRNDTTYIDTILTIQKDYKFNFRRQDNFELLDFHNQGQTFNNLGYTFSDASLFPDIGFNAKQFNYLNVKDIKYYEVPTPTTEIMARTGLQQGQVLDILFTTNFSKRKNFSIAYKGLRSLGQYRRSLSSTGNFRTTFSYRTPKDQYTFRAHATSQDFINQESGGLTESALENFKINDPNFIDRGRLDVNLESSNAENLFEGTRYYIDHNFKLFSSKDSTQQKDFSNLKIGHELTYERKKYKFIQSSIDTTFFGKAIKSSGGLDETTNQTFVNNQAYLEFNSKYILGTFKVKANYTNVDYGYDTIYNVNAAIEKRRLVGKALSLGGSWQGRIGNFKVNGDLNITPGSGHLAGNYLKGEALYEKDSLFTIKGSLLQSSKAPSFNTQLFQSTYNEYNWNNNFKNIDTRDLGFLINSKWGNASLNFTNIVNYVYFNEDNKPQQYDDFITYLKLKANKEFKVGAFALDNTLMYQNVSNGRDVFRVPEFVTRNTLYYMDHWFKGDPLLAQIGITFKYFTTYKANAYNPLLSEFTLQNHTDIGHPMVDVFFNARVKRTRIFFKIDNVFSSYLKKNYFTAPGYPYRDFVIRFGVVWNWFI